MEKVLIFMNKPVRLRLSKHREKAKLYYMNTDRSIVYIKTGDIYVDFAKLLKQDLIIRIIIT